MAGLIIELILVFLAFCAALMIGSNWPYFVLPAYLGLLSLKFTPLGKRVKVSRLFIASLAVGLLIALLVARGTYDWLSNVSVETASNGLYQFFAGAPVLRLFWSTILGITVAFDVLAVFLIPLAFFSAQGKYGNFETYKSHKAQATRTALYGMLGMSQGTWTVKDGKVEALNKQEGGLKWFGGPGDLVVQQGYAVILEKDGKISRIVASGLTLIEPFEMISMVISLFTRTESVKVTNVVTKDRIVIDEIELFIFHKVDSGEEHNQVLDGTIAYDPTILTQKVWSGSGSDWREPVKSISSRMLRDVAGRYVLEELVPLTKPRRKELADALKVSIEEITKNALGVEIRALDFGAIRFSTEIQARLLERWMAELEQDVMMTRAETEQHIQLTKALARMETIKAISQGLKQLVSSGADPEDLIALRYIDYLEQRAASSDVHSDDETGNLIKLQGIEALRSLMHSSNGKP